MILTTFSRVIQCEKFIKDESASLAVYASLYDLNMCILKTKGSKKEPVLRQIRKTTKKTTLWKWPKNMWKRIPHLMQQHNTPRKGQTNLNTLLITKKNQ